jgi:AraC-like DNA-binding protein
MRDLARLQKVSPLAMLGAAPLPRPLGPVRWAFDDMPARERPTLLRECLACAGVHYEFHPVGEVPFRVDLGMHALPGLMVVTGDLHASRRFGARERAAETRDDATLLVSLAGAHRIEQDGRDIVLGEGEATFTSCSDLSIMTHGDASRMLGLRFPKAGLAPLVESLDDVWARRISRELPALRLLRSYLTLVWDAQTQAEPDLEGTIVTHVYDLMAVAMGATRDIAAAAHARGLHAARLHAVKQDIGRHLGRTDLSVAMMAHRHACTPRFVQRLFEAAGTTFTEYVQAQRLARAYRVLADPRREAGKISAVAFDCGFGDVSYFNRVFRRRYGAAPSDVRAQARSRVGRGRAPSARG